MSKKIQPKEVNIADVLEDSKAYAEARMVDAIVDAAQLEEIPDELLQSVHPHHLKALTMYVSGMYTISEIARHFNVTAQTITLWFKRKTNLKIMRFLQERDAEFQDIYLRTLKNRAITKIDGLMSCGYPPVELSAAKAVLAFGGAGLAPDSSKKQPTSVEETMNLVEANSVEIIEKEKGTADVDINKVVRSIKSGDYKI